MEVIIGFLLMLATFIFIIPFYFYSRSLKFRENIIKTFNILFYTISIVFSLFLIFILILLSILAIYKYISSSEGFQRLLLLHLFLGLNSFFIIFGVVVAVLGRKLKDEGYIGLFISLVAAIGSLVSPLLNDYLTEDEGIHGKETGALVLTIVYFVCLNISAFATIATVWYARKQLIDDGKRATELAFKSVNEIIIKEKDTPSVFNREGLEKSN